MGVLMTDWKSDWIEKWWEMGRNREASNGLPRGAIPIFLQSATPRQPIFKLPGNMHFRFAMPGFQSEIQPPHPSGNLKYNAPPTFPRPANPKADSYSEIKADKCAPIRRMRLTRTSAIRGRRAIPSRLTWFQAASPEQFTQPHPPSGYAEHAAHPIRQSASSCRPSLACHRFRCRHRLTHLAHPASDLRLRPSPAEETPHSR